MGEKGKDVIKNILNEESEYSIYHFPNANLLVSKLSKEIYKQEEGEGYPPLAYSNEVVSCRTFTNEIDYSSKLLKYKKQADYYPNNQLENDTAQFANSISFRSHLCHFIKNEKLSSIIEGSDLFAYMLQTGETIVIHNGSPQEHPNLSSEEQLLFNLYCFAKLNEFWDEALELQTLTPAKKPIILYNVFCMLDEGKYPVETVLKQFLTLGHRIIIVEDC